MSDRLKQPPEKVNERLLKRILGEPLLHFLVLGALIFYAYSILSPAVRPLEDDIVVTREDADRLKAQFRTTWNRDPSPPEFRDLIDHYVRDEVLYREAKSYGLDRDDQVVRVRMRQKMEFLLTDPAAVPAPNDAELRALFEATKQKYVNPESISFQQIFLGDPTEAAAKAALGAAERGVDPAVVSQPSLLPAEVELIPVGKVDSAFGAGFFDRIVALPRERWTGPVRSAFGQHLVFVSEVRTSEAPSFDKVRSSVEAEWRRDATRKAAQKAYEAVKARYRIDLSQIGVTD